MVLVVVGDSRCGKTKLIQRFATDSFQEVGESGQSFLIKFRDGNSRPIFFVILFKLSYRLAHHTFPMF